MSPARAYRCAVLVAGVLLATPGSAAAADTTAPVVTDDVPPTYRTTGPVTVTLTARDPGGSDAASIRYLIGADPADPSDPANSPLVYSDGAKPQLADGERIRYVAVDDADNRSAVRTSTVVRISAGATNAYVRSVPGLSGATPGQSLVRDLDGDGRRDIALVNTLATGATVTILTKNAGAGYTRSTVATADDANELMAGDLDEDGDVDLVTSSHAGDGVVTLLRRTAGGAYTRADLDAGPNLNSAALADVDGDEDLDIVASTYDAMVLLSNDGAGTFAPSPMAAGTGLLNDIELADLNDDGRLDVAGADVNRSRVTTVTQGPGGTWAVANAGPTVGAPYWLEVADVDADGALDLVTVTGTGAKAITVLRRDPIGGAYSQSVAGTSTTVLRDLSVTDVNGDGRADLVVAQAQAPHAVLGYVAQAGGGFAATTLGTVDGQPQGTVAADVDGDARPDVVTGSSSGNVNLFTAVRDASAPTVTDDVPTAHVATGPRTVTLTPQDTGGSGLASVRYLVGADPADPSDPASGAAEYDPQARPQLEHGQRIRYVATDTAGNVGTVGTSAVLRVDAAPPVTTDDVPLTYGKDPVTVTLSASDGDGSGVDTTTYRVISAAGAEGSPETYSADDKPVLDDGEKVRYWSVDELGNYEAPKTSEAAKVDEVDPVTGDDVPTSWSKTPIAVTLSAVDEGGSGLGTTSYRVVSADGTEGTLETYDPAAKPVLTDGQRIRYSTSDGAANAETFHDSAEAKVDGAAPTTGGEVPVTYQSAPVTVTLTATDTGRSGVATTKYRVLAADGTEGEERTYSTAAKPVLADGEKLRFWSTDVAGNPESPKTSGAAKVDTANPVTVDDVPADFRDAPIPVTLTRTDDGGSGGLVTTYRIVSAQGTEGEAVEYDAAKKPSLSHGEKLRYWTTDAAGNTETAKTSGAAKVDTAKPQTSDDVPTTFRNTPVTVTLTRTDDGGSGGLVTRFVKIAADDSEGPETVYDPADRPTLLHGQKLRYWTTDAAGNIETAKTSGAAKVDTAKPVTTHQMSTAFGNAPVAVTLTATDEGGSEGLVTRFVKVAANDTEGPVTVYANDDKPTLAHGEKLRYWATDGAGNVEDAKASDAANVDTATPVTLDDVPEDFRRAAIPVTLTRSDDGGSGGLVTRFLKVAADGTEGAETAYDPAARPTLAHGEKLRYWTRDAAGNVETAKTSAAAKVDTATPVTTDDVPSAYRNAPVAVTLLPTDGGGSGGLVTTYRIVTAQGDEGEALTYDAAQKPVLGNGEKLRYWTTDGAGNTETAKTSAPAKVDSADPLTIDDVPSEVRDAPVIVTLTATDTGDSGGLVTTYRVVSAQGGESAPVTYDAAAKPVLADGERLRYSTADAAGNVEETRESTAAHVETGAPDTEVTTRPPSVGANRRPVVAWAPAPGITFECSLDGAPFAPCASPYPFGVDLLDGEHSLSIRAVNRAGTPDPTPATVAFAVDGTPPGPPGLVSGPAPSSPDGTHTIAFEGEAGGTFACSVDDAPFAACTSPVTVRDLSVGPHTFRVRQVDATGNEGSIRTVKFTRSAAVQPPPERPAIKTVAAAQGESVPVGGASKLTCVGDSVTVRGCAVRIMTSSGTVLAAGATTVEGPAAPSAEVAVLPTAAGRRALRQSPGGVPAVAEVTIVPPEGPNISSRTPTTFVRSDEATIPTGRSAKLPAFARRHLAALAQAYGSMTRVTCVGYTGKQPGVSAKAARKRSLTRARNACKLIRKAAPKLETASRGAGRAKPLATNRSRKGRRRNERVVVTFS